MYSPTELISLYVIALDKVEFDENQALHLKSTLFDLLVEAAKGTNTNDTTYGEQKI